MKPKSPRLQCSKCDKRYTSQSSLRNHFETRHSKQFKKTLKCGVDSCIKSFCTQKRLKQHVYRVHTNKLVYNCELKCGKVFRSKSALKVHMKTHSGEKNFICQVPNCGKSYAAKDALEMHIAGQHIKDRAFKCTECDKAYFSKRHLATHVKNVHTLREFPCTLCTQKFKTHRDMYRHITAVHTKERSFNCAKCVVTCPTSTALKAHQMSHTDERRYCCTICEKKFKRLSELRMHKTNLHSLVEQEFKCPTLACGKTFKAKTYLLVHINYHHNEKRKKYNCYFCPRLILRWESFATHVRTHTGEVPYNCKFKLCKYSSGSASNLASHIKQRSSHSRIVGNIWECYFCSRRFKFTENLSKHMWTHTRENYL